MTSKQLAELPQPCVSPRHFRAALVTPQLAPVFILPLPIVFPIRNNQIDFPLAKATTESVRIVTAIGNRALRFLSPTALRSWDADLLERGLGKRNFVRRGTFQPSFQRNTFTIDQYLPLCAFATLGFADDRAPFLAGRSCRRERLRPNAADPLGPIPLRASAKLPARPLALPTVAVVASRWKERETPPAGSATPPRFAKSTKYPRNKHGSTLAVGRAGPLDASLREARVSPTAIAHHSTASVAPS